MPQATCGLGQVGLSECVILSVPSPQAFRPSALRGDPSSTCPSTSLTSSPGLPAPAQTLGGPPQGQVMRIRPSCRQGPLWEGDASCFVSVQQGHVGGLRFAVPEQQLGGLPRGLIL